MSKPIVLELYVVNGAPDSEQALFVMKQLCKRLGEACLFRVIDVHTEPEEALSALILVTPTLIRREPGSLKRIIGRLQNEEQIITTLGLEASA
jgi:circadian clock protein KaiB